MKDGNYDKAHALIEPFAGRGDPLARRLMGRMYAFGLGVPVDVTRAQMWYRLAECNCAEPGQNEFDTALDLAKGFAGRKDAKGASDWLRRAAEAGNHDAQRLISDQARARAEGFDVSEEVSSYWQKYSASTPEAGRASG